MCVLLNGYNLGLKFVFFLFSFFVSQFNFVTSRYESFCNHRKFCCNFLQYGFQRFLALLPEARANSLVFHIIQLRSWNYFTLMWFIQPCLRDATYGTAFPVISDIFYTQTSMELLSNTQNNKSYIRKWKKNIRFIFRWRWYNKIVLPEIIQSLVLIGDLKPFFLRG